MMHGHTNLKGRNDVQLAFDVDVLPDDIQQFRLHITELIL